MLLSARQPRINRQKKTIKNYIEIMDKDTKQILTREPYEAPSCEVLRFKSKGILCTSMNGAMLLEDATVDDWGTL